MGRRRCLSRLNVSVSRLLHGMWCCIAQQLSKCYRGQSPLWTEATGAAQNEWEHLRSLGGQMAMLGGSAPAFRFDNPLDQI